MHDAGKISEAFGVELAELTEIVDDRGVFRILPSRDAVPEILLRRKAGMKINR